MDFINANTLFFLFLFPPRYDFRMRVARVLGMETARITILPPSPIPAAGGVCQRVDFMVSGKMESPVNIYSL